MEMEIPEKRFSNTDMMNQEHFSQIESHLARQDECQKNIIMRLDEISTALKESCKDDIIDKKEFTEWVNENFASKATEKLVWVLAFGVCTWALQQVLSLIPTAHAVYESLTK